MGFNIRRKFLQICAISIALVSFPTFRGEIDSALEYSQAELMCLATAVYHEARHESNIGMAAVAHVVINRVESNRFPKTICGVVKQRSATLCQFSWVCDKIRHRTDYVATSIAWNVLEERADSKKTDPTRGALFFQNKHMENQFPRKRLATIGNHNFYK